MCTDQELLPLMCRIKYELDSHDFLEELKVRLFARGNLQTTDSETYAATLASQTLRACMVMIAAFNLELKRYDAITAFVNASLDEPLPFESPDSYIRGGEMLAMLQAIYGLKESP